MPCLDRPLISVHFPKASGTSFRLALQTAFGEAAVLGTYETDPMNTDDAYWIYPAWFKRNRPRNVHPFQVVHGHFRIEKYDLLPAACRIVMLREPVDNVISMFYHWRSLFDTQIPGHALYRLFKQQQLTLLEFAEMPMVRRLMSQTYFGGYDMRRFDLIGSYDRRTEFIQAVSRLVGVPLALDDRANTTAPFEERDNAAADTGLRAKLHELLQDDLRFYECYAEGLGRPRLSAPFYVAGGQPDTR
jgi:hypothetical protein